MSAIARIALTRILFLLFKEFLSSLLKLPKFLQNKAVAGLAFSIDSMYQGLDSNQ
jgi:hypothetical protein